jgi:hypothetical protein
MSSVKKTTYNVNSIIGKYIMPVIVTFRNDTLLSQPNEKGERKPQTYAVIYKDAIYNNLISKINIDRLKNRKYSQLKAKKIKFHYQFIKAYQKCDNYEIDNTYRIYMLKNSLRQEDIDYIKLTKDNGLFNHNIYRWEKRQNRTNRRCDVILMDEYIRQNILFRALVFGNKYYQAFSRTNF